jgi:hypothetical protein
MKMGIVGLPQSGKTTIFNAITGSSADVGTFGSQKAANLALIKVPDERVDVLAEIYEAERKTYTEISFIDVAPSDAECDRNVGFDAHSLSLLRATDGLTAVVRAFENPAIPPGHGSVDPVRDLDELTAELILADMLVVENRMKKLAKDHMKSVEWNVLERCKVALESEQPLRDIALNDQEKQLVSPFSFLTLKPMLVLANISEADIGKPDPADLESYCAEHSLELLALCGELEMEISEIPADERVEFLREMGIEEPAHVRFVQAAYSGLGLITFITAGKPEARAWAIAKGSSAVEAAGKVHTDMARGFIRAEIVTYDDFVAAGSLAEAKHQGTVRVEGKERVVNDGDIILFLFNV